MVHLYQPQIPTIPLAHLIMYANNSPEKTVALSIQTTNLPPDPQIPPMSDTELAKAMTLITLKAYEDLNKAKEHFSSTPGPSCSGYKPPDVKSDALAPEQFSPTPGPSCSGYKPPDVKSDPLAPAHFSPTPGPSCSGYKPPDVKSAPLAPAHFSPTPGPSCSGYKPPDVKSDLLAPEHFSPTPGPSCSGYKPPDVKSDPLVPSGSSTSAGKSNDNKTDLGSTVGVEKSSDNKTDLESTVGAAKSIGEVESSVDAAESIEKKTDLVSTGDTANKTDLNEKKSAENDPLVFATSSANVNRPSGATSEITQKQQGSCAEGTRDSEQKVEATEDTDETHSDEEADQLVPLPIIFSKKLYFEFKARYSLSTRRRKFMSSKKPGYTSIIVEKAPSCEVVYRSERPHKNYCIRSDAAVHRMAYVIHVDMKIDRRTPIHLFSNGELIDQTAIIGDIYKKYHDRQDLFLYLHYSDRMVL